MQIEENVRGLIYWKLHYVIAWAELFGVDIESVNMV